MKVCFCGLGSIGKRHLANLLQVAGEFGISLEIHALRKTERVLDSEIKGNLTKQINHENNLDRDYDIAFITNPTHLHYASIETMTARTNHMFIEKPVFDSIDYDLKSLALNEEGVCYVARPLRYSGVIQTLKGIILKEKVFCARVICSSYLPDWRPNTDYRQVYSARKAEGGGVAIDLIHEWDYITLLFGFPQRVYPIFGKYSHLDIDSDDLAVYIAEYKDKVVELHLDYFGRIPRREIELFTENGAMTGDLIHNTISFTDGRKQICFEEDKNDVYLREMRFFMDRVLKNQYFNNMDYCYKILSLALGKVETAVT